MDVLTFSQKTKQEADTLLEQGSVLAVLSKYGEVIITGAYAYDLMWAPDIDITVVANNPKESAHNALNEFILQKSFRKYQLGDFITFPLEGRPEGIIVVLIHEHMGRKWEVEIWFKKSLSEDDNHFSTLLSTATEEQRKTILELKQQRDNTSLSKDQLSSAAIYIGVLLEGKRSVSDF